MKASQSPAVAALATTLALALEPLARILLRWYLAETRTLEIAQAPNETIHTYPLA